jgi:hypothetical protein
MDKVVILFLFSWSISKKHKRGNKTIPQHHLHQYPTRPKTHSVQHLDDLSDLFLVSSSIQIQETQDPDQADDLDPLFLGKSAPFAFVDNQRKVAFDGQRDGGGIACIEDEVDLTEQLRIIVRRNREETLADLIVKDFLGGGAFGDFVIHLTRDDQRIDKLSQEIKSVDVDKCNQGRRIGDDHLRAYLVVFRSRMATVRIARLFLKILRFAGNLYHNTIQ